MSRWSYTAGSRPYSVRVYERREGGNLYIAAWDPTARGGEGGEIRRSLGHKDREKAKAYAEEQAAKLRKRRQDAFGKRPTVRRVFRLYLRERTPDKSEAIQRADRRQLEAFQRFLGPDFDLSNLSRREWDRYSRERQSGAIDPRGHQVPEEAPCAECEGDGCPDPGCERCEGTGTVHPRSPVGPRTTAKDLKTLRAVCRWATEYRTDDGHLLMEDDPTRGLELPEEKNPSRPVATHDRVDAIRDVYEQVEMRVEWDGERRMVESYLPEIFEIVVGTGRRISAVCGLREENLELERTPQAPSGAIVWPEDTDKQGRRWRCPISVPVREALEAALRKRPRVGPGPLFPAPKDVDETLHYRVASDWLREAEELAGVEPHDGSLWHAYRRLWASARKEMPDVDVAQAGGWSSVEALKLAYQHPDQETMLRVVEHDTELREVK